MKPIIPRLSTYTALFFFSPLLIIRRKGRFYMLLLLGMLILTGCFNKFYSTGTTYQVDSTTVEKLKNAKKYFILHYEDSILALSNISINSNVVSGNTGPLAKIHSRHLNPGSEKYYHFKKAYETSVLSEVHLYVNYKKADSAIDPFITIPASDIYRVDINEFDKKKTNASTVLSIVGIATYGIIAIVVCILAVSGGLPVSIE